MDALRIKDDKNIFIVLDRKIKNLTDLTNQKIN